MGTGIGEAGGGCDRRWGRKVKLYGVVISAVSSLIAITVFLGWDDDIKKAIGVTPQAPSAVPTSPWWAPPETTEYVVDDEPTIEATTETTTETTWTPSPEELRQDYITRADSACATAVNALPGWVPTLDYGYMMAVLEARNRMLQDWSAVVVEPRDAANHGRIQQMWNDFQNASTFWNYMANNLLQEQRTTFYAELERYRAATAAFVNAANRYGFTVCNFPWNTVN